MNFTKVNRAVITNLQIDPIQSVQDVFNDIIKNFPFTLKSKPKKENKEKDKDISNSQETSRFTTDLQYRFDLDYD
jgi:hypothetical protein